MAANSSTTRLAPPTSAPSTSGSRMKLAMLPDLTDPPYRMRVRAAASSSRTRAMTAHDYDPDDPRYGVYEWLGYRLEGLLQVLDD